MTETANDIAEQSRERLLARLLDVLDGRESATLEGGVYVQRYEEDSCAHWIQRVEKAGEEGIRCRVRAGDDGGEFCWTFADMSFDELFNVCRQLEAQTGRA